MNKIVIITLSLVLLINFGAIFYLKVFESNYIKEYEGKQSSIDTQNMINDFEKRNNAGEEEYGLVLPIIKAGVMAEKTLKPYLMGVVVSLICSILNLIPLSLAKFADLIAFENEKREIMISSSLFFIVNMIVSMFAFNDAMGFKAYLDGISKVIGS